VNYNQTNFGYDSLGRLQWSETPNGTYTYDVLDYRGLVLSTWAGTDDGGLPALAKATQSPSMLPTTGSGSNMIDLVDYYYDGSSPGTTVSRGDGLLTAQVQNVDSNSADDRVALYGYDSRDELQWTMVNSGEGLSQFSFNENGTVPFPRRRRPRRPARPGDAFTATAAASARASSASTRPSTTPIPAVTRPSDAASSRTRNTPTSSSSRASASTADCASRLPRPPASRSG
jgi:hypothetical protein